MKSLSLRTSLSAWFVALALLLVGGFATLLYASTARALDAGLDARLRARAETLAALCELEEDTGAVELELSPEIAGELARAQPGLGVEVTRVGTEGSVHCSGVALPAFAGWTGEAAARPRLRFDTSAGEESLRICSYLAHVRPRAEPGGELQDASAAPEVLVRVSESRAPREAELARIAWSIAWLAGPALLAIFCFGIFLSRRFTRPVGALAHAAAAYRTGKPVAMPQRGSGDELDQLAEVLDGAFAALDGAVERQARFTADAAHELKNPIAVIKSAAEIALRRERSSEEYRAFLQDVLETSKRMGGAVEGLLLLARLDAGELSRSFGPVDLVEIVREIGAEARVSIEGEHVVRGEANLLRILIGNLVANAVRHGRGLPVEIELAHDAEGCSLLSVRDRGAGIPPHLRALVFERFVRLASDEPVSSGAGLGLAIVAQIVQVHAAECRIEDAAPGARVIVRFASRSAAASLLQAPYAG